MQITKEISDAVRRAVDQAGSQSELSRKTGVSQGTISDICSVNRRRNNFARGTFLSLYPYLRPYLPESYAPSSATVQVMRAADGDFIFARITEIYARLDRAERAELLAAAERIAERKEERK